MWLIWGLVSFIVVISVMLYRKLYVSWGAEESLPKSNCHYKHITQKGNIVSLLLGIEGVHKYRFSLKRESSIHDFGKWCGLAREFQTGDGEFDRLIYILSDNHLLHNKLAASAEVRSAISTIFSYGINHLAKVEELVCSDGKLWIVLKVGSSYGPGTVTSIADALVPKLNIIRQEINSISPRNVAFWRDPVFLKAMVLFSISSGLAINGFIHLMRISYLPLPFLVDVGQLVKLAIVLGVGICALLIVVVFFFIGRSARTHLVVFEILTMGLVGAVATSFIELRDFNIETDILMPSAVVADVRQKYVKHGRKSGTRYYVVFDDWRCHCTNLTVKVPYDIYSELKVNEKADLLLHPGALGYEWVSKIRAHQGE